MRPPTLAPPPAQLVDPQGGLAPWGRYGEPIPTLNPWSWSGLPWIGAELRVKQWLYFGVVGPELFVGGAVVDLGYVGNVFCYVRNRATGQLVQSEWILPLSLGLKVNTNMVTGCASFVSPGTVLRIEDNREAGQHRVTVRARKFEIDLQLEDRSQPLVCLNPAGSSPDRYGYTVKMAGLPASGRIRAGNGSWTISPAECSGVLDFTLAVPPRDTYWNWASGAGFSAEGRRVGLNLSTGLYDSGGPGENGFWLDGRLIPVGRACFEYDHEQLMEPWTVRSKDGRVDLRFEPEGERKQDTNFLLVASSFHQPFGTYRGTLTDDEGKRHEVELSGFTEEHHALW